MPEICAKVNITLINPYDGLTLLQFITFSELQQIQNKTTQKGSKISYQVHDEELQDYEECRSCHENLLRTSTDIQVCLPRINGKTDTQKQRYRLAIMDHNIADARYWISISKGFANHKQIRKYLKLKNIRRNMVESYNLKQAATA